MCETIRLGWARLLPLALLVLLTSVACATGGTSAPAPADRAVAPPPAPAAPPPPPPPPAAVGKWKMTIETPQGTQEPILSIMGTDGDLSGTFTGQGGELEIEKVSFSDNTLEFSVTVDIQGQMIDLGFSGTLDGDKVTGTLDTPFGGFPANAVRVVE